MENVESAHIQQLDTLIYNPRQQPYPPRPVADDNDTPMELDRETAIVVAVGTGFLVLFQALFGLQGDFFQLMASMSSFTGIILGITKYYRPPAPYPVLYRPEIEKTEAVELADVIELKLVA